MREVTRIPGRGLLTLAEVEAAIWAVLERELGPFKVVPATRRVWRDWK